MEPDIDKPGNAAPEEIEVAYYTKELGRPLQRKMLQGRFNSFADSTISAVTHGEEAAREADNPLPREDRAG